MYEMIKLSATSEMALLDKLNKHFRKTGTVPKTFQVIEKKNGEWVCFIMQQIREGSS